MDAEAKARALRAAQTAAKAAGLPTVSPAVLDCSRHISVLLPEASTVARMMIATDQNVATAMRELAVSRFLAAKSAPVVAPSSVMPALPYIAEHMTVTLWPHVAHQKADDDDQDAIAHAAHALRRVHDALADYPDTLPSYKLKLDECAALLHRPAALPALSAADRSFLTSAYERLTGDLAAGEMRVSPIHGDAHLGNVLFASSGPLWTDFEAASIGPREWDVSGVPFLAAFRDIDPAALALMSDLRSFCVSVWCWALAADPEKRTAAEYHRERLRRAPRRS